MKLMVKRAAGDRLSPEPIVNVLCNSSVSAESCGKAYLYKNGFEKKIYQLKVPFILTACGNIVELQDPDLGENFKAKINSWKIKISLQNKVVNISQEIKIERPLIDE